MFSNLKTKSSLLMFVLTNQIHHYNTGDSNTFYLFSYIFNNKYQTGGKWFEPRSLSRLCGLIVRVRVVMRRTVVGDIDRRFDNLSRSHHQSHVNCVSSVYHQSVVSIYISGQLSHDVIGCFKWNHWLSRDVIGCWLVRSCCYLLWRLIGRR